MSEDNTDLNNDHKKKLEHLSDLVMLSMADSNISHGEQIFLDNYANYLGVKKEEYHDVLLNPERYQFNIPVTEKERIEQLYYLVKFSFSDGEILSDEVNRMEKIAMDLGFGKERMDKLIRKAIHLVINKYEFEKFSKKINKFLNKYPLSSGSV
jgi:uncharacterized tellurite resistance protein B-like protein